MFQHARVKESSHILFLFLDNKSYPGEVDRGYYIYGNFLKNYSAVELSILTGQRVSITTWFLY